MLEEVEEASTKFDDITWCGMVAGDDDDALLLAYHFHSLSIGTASATQWIVGYVEMERQKS